MSQPSPPKKNKKYSPLYCWWFRNPAWKPVEVGSWFHYLQDFLHPIGGAGFLNHQQYHPLMSSLNFFASRSWRLSRSPSENMITKSPCGASEVTIRASKTQLYGVYTQGFLWDFGIFTDPWMVDFYGKCRLIIIPVIHGWYGYRIHPTVFWAKVCKFDTKVPLSNAFCWHGWRFASWFYLLNTFQTEGSSKWFMNILFGNFGTS